MDEEFDEFMENAVNWYEYKFEAETLTHYLASIVLAARELPSHGTLQAENVTKMLQPAMYFYRMFTNEDLRIMLKELDEKNKPKKDN